MAFKIPILLSIIFSVLVRTVTSSNPFSSNVVALTAQNWKEEVENSPHAVFVNICRIGWGYCQLPAPEFEKLAKAVKGTVKIAYWDTEQKGRRPTLLGDFQGTPTLRLYKPKRKQKPGRNAEKIFNDYQYERKAVDMKRFLDAQMQDFVEKIKEPADLVKFEEKAKRNNLPRVYLFSSKPNTSPLTKYLSVEFRRRLLLAEIKPNKKNEAILKQFGVTELPALIVVPPLNEGEESTEPEAIRYDGDGFTRNKLNSFLSKHALKDPVSAAKKKDEATSEPQESQTEERENDKKKSKQKVSSSEL